MKEKRNFIAVSASIISLLATAGMAIIGTTFGFLWEKIVLAPWWDWLTKKKRRRHYKKE